MTDVSALAQEGVSYTKNGTPHPDDAGTTTIVNYLYAQIKSLLGVP